ncbi:MAG: reductive dehalogenase [Candidatus Hermodarchaeia archaeon]
MGQKNTQQSIHINETTCNPSKCQQECVKVCPIHQRKTGPFPITFSKRTKTAEINTDHCTACEKCIPECPLSAISTDTGGSKSRTQKRSGPEYDINVWLKTPYVIDEESFRPFREENTIFARVMNDPDFPDYQSGIYTHQDAIIQSKRPGYSKNDAALSSAAWTVYDHFRDAFSWKKLQVSPEAKFDAELAQPEIREVPIEDLREMTHTVKQAAKAYGAAVVGVCNLNRNWIYSHDKRGQPINIPEHITYAIVIGVEMDLESLQTSPAYPASFATGNGYSRMAFIQSCVAEFIRALGYEAIPAGNNVGLSIPLAIDAGLGEYGRHGLLINPEFGSNLRICKVLTNLPLIPDKPKNIGALRFCRTCKRCAESCPSQSISYDDNPTWSGFSKSNNIGILKWYVNVETCYHFWTQNGNDCSNCIVSCPFTKNRHWSHRLARFFIKHLPFLNRLFVKLDKTLGYGKQRDPTTLWAPEKEFIQTRKGK